MMHGWGGGWGATGMGFLGLGLVPLVIVAGVVFFVLRFRFTAGRRDLPVDQGPRKADLYRLAAERHGRVTVSDVVVNLGIEPHEAEHVLEEAIDGVRVHMEIEQDGTIAYYFSELIDGE